MREHGYGKLHTHQHQHWATEGKGIGQGTDGIGAVSQTSLTLCVQCIRERGKHGI